VTVILALVTHVTWTPSDDEALESILDRNRLAALRRLLLLDTPPSPGFDRITRLTARLLDVPVALVNLVDADRQWTKSQHGLPDEVAEIDQVPLHMSLCQHVVASGGTLSVGDAAEEPHLRDHPIVTGLGVRAYAGSPVRSPDGYVVGALCAVDLVPRRWTVDQLDLLDELAALATREVALHVHERREGHRRLWDGIAWQPSTS
jgi:GAF domain-containing protein